MQAQEAQEEQMSRNELILETMMDGYILADTSGKIIDVNPACSKLLGYSRQELLKMNIRERLHRPRSSKKSGRWSNRGHIDLKSNTGVEMGV